MRIAEDWQREMEDIHLRVLSYWCAIGIKSPIGTYARIIHQHFQCQTLRGATVVAQIRFVLL